MSSRTNAFHPFIKSKPDRMTQFLRREPNFSDFIAWPLNTKLENGIISPDWWNIRFPCIDCNWNAAISSSWHAINKAKNKRGGKNESNCFQNQMSFLSVKTSQRLSIDLQLIYRRIKLQISQHPAFCFNWKPVLSYFEAGKIMYYSKNKYICNQILDYFIFVIS